MKQGRVALSLAKIDIDNDGSLESVLKFRDGACESPHDDFRVLHQPLVVLKDDRMTIDQVKTDLVMQNPGKRKERSAGFARNQLYDVFQYRGQTYFDKWSHDDLNFDLETFLIYQVVDNKITALCKYRYHRRYQSYTPGGKP